MHHLLLTPDGHKGFSELQAMVTHFADFFDTAPFMRSLCMALFVGTHCSPLDFTDLISALSRSAT